MAQSQSSIAGVVIAVAVLVGSFVGGLKGQPSIGFLAGLGIGTAIAVGAWLVRR